MGIDICTYICDACGEVIAGRSVGWSPGRSTDVSPDNCIQFQFPFPFSMLALTQFLDFCPLLVLIFNLRLNFQKLNVSSFWFYCSLGFLFLFFVFCQPRRGVKFAFEFARFQRFRFRFRPKAAIKTIGMSHEMARDRAGTGTSAGKSRITTANKPKQTNDKWGQWAPPPPTTTKDKQ